MPHKMPETPDEAGDAFKTDYEVGYKRPPMHTRFKPGQCGNPRGRPPKYTSFTSQVREAMAQKVSVVENGRRKKLAKGEIIATGMVNRAAKGSVRDVATLIQLTNRFEVDEPSNAAAAITDAEAEAIIDLYIQKRLRGKGGAI